MPSVDPKPTPAVDVSFPRPPEGATPSPTRELPAWALPHQLLRRTGLRPFAFSGVTVATVCGVTPALPYWYELNVHRSATGSYVSDIRLFRKGSDQPDLFRVAEHADLDATVGHLEGYDPAGDLELAADLLDDAPSNAALALRAAKLQIEVNRITEHYRSMVCQLLGAVIAQAD